MRGTDTYPVEEYPRLISRLPKVSDEYILELEKFVINLNKEWKVWTRKKIKLSSDGRGLKSSFLGM